MSNSEYNDREWERVLQEAVAAERERAAKLCESLAKEYAGTLYPAQYACESAAAAIRKGDRV